jgi:crotonobetainyl-CoA:carnitine CoA-transferase CaiB-like acyl-CoA transferase
MYAVLEGLKILDLSRLLPGALCSMMLADMGAEVLKIEDTSKGDYMRWMPPMVKELSAYFLLTNRNKRSMKLDLKAPQGREIFLKLVKQYDVVLESFRPGVMDRLGLGYEALRKENQGIVYCALSGYGQEGPYRDLVGHDINYIALGGVLSSTGTEQGQPTIPSVQLADIGVGSLMSAIGILSAIIHQRATGKGLFIDVSMLDGVVFWMHLAFAEFFTTGNLPKPGHEMLTGKFPCYNVYETKDNRYVAVGALEAKFWATLCTAIERPALIEHQYATGKKREEVIGELREIFRSKGKDEWVALFKNHDICFAPVNTLDEVYEDEQLNHRRMFLEMDHPSDGRIKQINSPLKYVGAEEKHDVPAPAYGEHTDEILRQLGYTDQAIEKLHNDGIV